MGLFQSTHSETRSHTSYVIAIQTLDGGIAFADMITEQIRWRVSSPLNAHSGHVRDPC